MYEDRLGLMEKAKMKARETGKLVVPLTLSFVMILATSLALSFTKDVEELSKLQQFMVPITFAVIAVSLSATGAHEKLQNMFGANGVPNPVLSYVVQLFVVGGSFIVMQWGVEKAKSEIQAQF